MSTPVLVSGIVLAGVGVGIGLKKMDYDNIPMVALMSACFFVGSIIHVPIGLSSVHLLLNGVIGLLLGWMAFPAIMTALLLQAMLFGFGGITTLGINTLNMALPALIWGCLFGHAVKDMSSRWSAAGGFACGFLCVGTSAVLTAASLWLSNQGFIAPAKLILIAHLPIMLIEGVITSFIVVFLKKVRPEILEMSS